MRSAYYSIPVTRSCILLKSRWHCPTPNFPRPGFIFIVERGALHILGSGATAANVSLQARLMSFFVLG